MRFAKPTLFVCLSASIAFTITVAGAPAAGEQQIREDLAQPAALERQYHIAALPVSPAVLLPVSVVESALNRAANRRREIASESARDRDEEAMREQYHEQIRLQIGLGLAAVYVLFLAGWFWFTRIRPRRH